MPAAVSPSRRTTGEAPGRESKKVRDRLTEFKDYNIAREEAGGFAAGQ